MSRIYRYEVPVDDQWHEFPELNGDIIHVAACRPTVVEFWGPRRFRVYGTGHDMPPQPRTIWGTALAGQLVWHLVEEGHHMLPEPSE